jgi:putative phosphoribosyl transferase
MLTSPGYKEAKRGLVEDSCILLHLDHVILKAEFTSVPEPRGMVIFATGSGSARHSPRNRYVAESLRTRAGFATLLVDLLARGETAQVGNAQSAANDVQLLSRRLIAATDWVRSAFHVQDLPIGYLGASTGAAAALVASTERPEVTAVVSRGGRPDLADDVLERVVAPTLFIAGREDNSILEVNRVAHRRLGGTSELTIVPGASYLFEEPHALDDVARHACDWFQRYLREMPERSGVSVRGDVAAR